MRLAVYITGLAAVAVAYLRFETTSDTGTISLSMGDLLNLYYPTLEYGFAQLRDGHLPLWNPYQAAGTPFLADPQVGFFYPPYAPFLFLDAATAFLVDYVVHAALAGTCMFLLCRHLGLRPAAAGVAGLAYSYQGAVVIALGYPTYRVWIAWMPLIFLLADRVMIRPSARVAAALGLVLGGALLGGYMQHAYFTAWALLPIMAVRAAQLVARGEAPSGLGRSLALLAAAGILGLLVAGIRIIPTMSLVSQTERAPGAMDIEDAGWGPTASAIVEAGLRSSPQFETSPWKPQTRGAYVGVTVLCLAIPGLLAWRNRALAAAIAFMGLAAANYAMGAKGSIYPALFELPGGDWFRDPQRALVVAGFATALLAAAGVDTALARDDRRRARFTLTAVLLTAFGLSVAAWSVTDPSSASLTATYGAAATVLLALARTDSTRRRGLCVLLLAALVTADLWHAQPPQGPLPGAFERALSDRRGLWQELRRRQGFDRSYFWGHFGLDSFFRGMGKMGIQHRVWAATDYSIPKSRFERYIRELGVGPTFAAGHTIFEIDADNLALLRMLGVRFAITGADDDPRRHFQPPSLAEVSFLRRDHDLQLFELGDAMPRVLLVPAVEVRPADQILEGLKKIDPQAVALIEEPVAGLPGKPAVAPAMRAEIAAYEPGRIRVATNASTPAFLLLAEQFDEGWRASVDGRPVAIARANFLYQGVPIPAGAQEVEFRYRPMSFATGLALTSAGLVSSLALVVWGSRKPRRGSRPPGSSPGVDV